MGEGQQTDVGKGATCFTKKNQGTREKNLTEKRAASVQEAGSKADRRWETIGGNVWKIRLFCNRKAQKRREPSEMGTGSRQDVFTPFPQPQM